MVKWDRQNIFRFFVTAVFVGAFVAMFIPFFSEILLAGIFAFAVEPRLGKVLQAKHLRWRPSVAVILILFFTVVLTPISIVGYKAYAFFSQIAKSGFQNSEFFKKLVLLKTGLLDRADSLLGRMNLTEQIDLSALSDDGMNSMGNWIMGASTSLVTNLPALMISIFVFCVALYFFLAEAGPIRRGFYRWELLPKGQADKLIHILQTSSYMTVVTSIVIGCIQASVVTIGAIACAAGDAVVVFVATFFFSFIPVIGAAPVALVLASYKFVIGMTGQGIALLIVAMVAGTVDNLVRPYLISSYDEGLHPLVSLMALIGALVVFGMPGLFLGPVIASVAVRIYPVLYPRS